MYIFINIINILGRQIVKYDRRCQKSAHAQIDKRMTVCFSFIRYKCCDSCLFLHMLTNDIEKLDSVGFLSGIFSPDRDDF
jgi:hypothetical protein